MRFDYKYLRVSGNPSKPEKHRWHFRKQEDISLNSSPRSGNDFALSASTSSGQTGSGDIEVRSIPRQGCYTSTNATRPIIYCSGFIHVRGAGADVYVSGLAAFTFIVFTSH